MTKQREVYSLRQKVSDVLDAINKGIIFQHNQRVGCVTRPHEVGRVLEGWGAVVGRRLGKQGKTYRLTAPGQFLLVILIDGTIEDSQQWIDFPIARWAFLTSPSQRPGLRDAELHLLDFALRRLSIQSASHQRQAINLINQYGLPTTKALLTIASKVAGQPGHRPFSDISESRPPITHAFLLSSSERALFNNVQADIQSFDEDGHVHAKEVLLGALMLWAHIRGL